MKHHNVMTNKIKLKKGLNIRILGEASKTFVGDISSDMYGLRPTDFPGLTPKLDVQVGDTVKAGTPLFHSKHCPDIFFVSPVSGTVSDIVRGEKRKLLEVVVKRSGDEYVDFGKSDVDSLSREKIIDKMLGSGLWPMVRQRPYHVVANPKDKPKSIFISGFDTAPLAPDYSFITDFYPQGLFQKGLDVLKRLTDGKVHLVLSEETASKELTSAKGVEITYVSGPHPAGNVGVHIHHIDPVNKGEVVWYVNLQDVMALARLFNEGIYKPERVIALTGSEIVNSGYYRVLAGVSIEPMVKGNTKIENVRYISGNVLTGTKIEKNGSLCFYDSQISVIPEGDYYEMFGWAKPGLKKYTFSRAFLSAICKKSKYRLDTNFHGEERAFVVTGQYEKVVPMDIYPMQLFKAILAEDIDMMEKLGIYEVAEEDFALCEFICTSKIEIQSIIRQGLDLMMKEMA